jgi:hypothetical protein
MIVSLSWLLWRGSATQGYPRREGFDALNDILSCPITSVFSQQSIVHTKVFCYNKEKKIKMDVYML